MRARRGRASGQIREHTAVAEATAARAHPRLVARTVRLDLPDSASLIDLLPQQRPLAWVRHGQGLVGWGEVARLETSGPDRFAEAEAWWRDLVAHAVVRDEVGAASSGPIAFGSFSFLDSGRSLLVVPQVVVGRSPAGSDGQGRRLPDITWMTTIDVDGGLPAAAELPTVTAPRAPLDLRFADGALPPAAWEARVGEAVRRIVVGEVDKVVLARDLEARSAEPLDVRWLLQRLSTRYPSCWSFSVDGLVGATPEMLVRLERGLVTSRVLAGTIKRTGDDTADAASAGRLARSSKDLEEHEYAVRSVADALAPYCSSRNVPESPFVLHLPNVMHLATDVAGVAAPGVTSLTLAAALHPSAAVCGTPTDAARRLICELEGMDRGRYAGPVGWMSASGDGEWGIALRSGQVEPDDPSRIRLFAGCGIVAGSDPAAELAESNAKLVPMRDALASD
ncbi:MAG: isochorismate synthase [Actinomycetes bacterium]